MKTSYIFLATGFEEIEAVAPIDVLRRAGMPVTTVSVNDSRQVQGAHGVPYIADITIADLPATVDAEWLILPGGMPGATNLLDCQPLVDLLTSFPGHIAAICASPSVVLGSLGLLKGKRATCYPGMENWSDNGATMTGADVERDGRFITGRGPALAIPFAAAIVETSLGKDKADEVLSGMLYL
ncbi:MAG: DJ-1/PfpI family protein [Bacteroides sp.]|nr:DJ-1/PfpI family protein [Bacteroides sp.]MCM1378883.1 DJ-1/PfpI family protein [Bacteroides sp.]MCM1445499.1 DJ-1/PfpI family protein [Prevotella sp.]